MVIPDIAAQERIPRKFLEHILLDLKHHGLVESRRGKFGYGLRLAPDRISFGQVLRIIDGPIAPLACLSATAYRRCSDCKSEEACEIRRVFKVAESARDVLDRTTIADSLASSLLDDQLPKAVVHASARL
jgi:Rrf2 family protein